MATDPDTFLTRFLTWPSSSVQLREWDESYWTIMGRSLREMPLELFNPRSERDCDGMTNEDIIVEILAIRDNLITYKLNGPYRLYIPKYLIPRLDQDYNPILGAISLHQRMRQIEGVTEIYLKHSGPIQIAQIVEPLIPTECLTSQVQDMLEACKRDITRLPLLADALEDAGCSNTLFLDILRAQ